ncbi:MAG: sulfotransferase [Deltaproteobacteria bacterium]|nr:sulfotransferase [Deltaproteobacteria bacterium]
MALGETAAPLPERLGALVDEARRATGLHALGPDEWREGLECLLEAAEREANLTTIGRGMLFEQVVTGLVGRLHSEAGFANHPDVESVPIERPILVVGMPRTASTTLHRLLIRDPALQGLEMWLADTPMRRPPRATWPSIPAFVECDRRTRALFEAAPELRAIHDMDADEVDECWHLLRQSFATVNLECTFRIPSYSRWWAACDMGPMYRRYRRNLQLIGGGAPGQRWLLKDATHMFHLDRFLEVFPDACVVTTMRDPAKMIPSVASLTTSVMRPAVADFDPIAHGQAQLELWVRGLRRIDAVCAGLPRDRFYRMEFEDFQADPVAEVRRIHARFGLELSREAEAAMRSWLERNRKGRHGEHAYRAEDYGLSPERIRAAFA